MLEEDEDKQNQELLKKEFVNNLVQRLQNAQLKIKETKQLIDEEKELRIKATRDLENSRNQIKTLLIKQSQTTTEKVEDLIKNTLQKLVDETIQKQNELKDIQLSTTERCYLNKELETQFQGLRSYIHLTTKEIKDSDEYALKLKTQILKQTNTNLLIKSDIDEKEQKIQQMKLEAQSLRATIQNLNDVKKVINRVTDKDQLIIGTKKNSSRNQSRNHSYQQSHNPYNSYDIDDQFWYADKSIKLPSVQSQRKKQQF